MKVSLTIYGEPASKANSRMLVILGRGPKARAASIKSEKALAYEKTALEQIPPNACAMFTGPVRVTMTIHYASERPDLDESVILDVLQAKYAKNDPDGPELHVSKRALLRAGVYVNDRQVREKHVYHAIDRANPRAVIEVEELAAGLFEEIPALPVAPKPARRVRHHGAPPIRTPAAVLPGNDPF